MSGREGDVLEVTVERIGRRGDGISRLDDGTPVYVPLALPGDRLRVRLGPRRGEGYASRIVAEVRRVPRAAPPCPHFGRCGGCQLQHLEPEAYAAWQRLQVIEALARRGLEDVPVRGPRITPPGTRRRVRLAWERRRRHVRLGFRTRAGHELVALEVCPVAVPAIEALIAPLRALLAKLPMAAGRGEVQITAADAGPDVLLIGPNAPGLADREALAAFAEAEDLARLAWQHWRGGVPEPIVARRDVVVRLGDVPVALPPGAFLQASAEAEAWIRAAVEEAVGDAAHVADLFAGCGTLALPLAAAGRRVLAVEHEPAMLEALEAAARAAGFARRVRVERRDLDARPVRAAELRELDAVVLDPPAAGARAQSAALGRADVARVAMASCEPATFARDARTLVDGGYALAWVQPIDAFLWSSRIELVGAFTRARAS